MNEKKIAVVRSIKDGADIVILQPVVIQGRTLAAARREVLQKVKALEGNTTVVWLGWFDSYELCYATISVA